ncbi:MAG: hypothetical protein IPM16_19550 [Chloroflexi bacterium]|nr:hypothetical protein [Chloroflexota bacterium]
MVELVVYQALILFAWFPLAFLLAVLLLIARFYDRFSPHHTYWRLYGIPVLGYAAAFVREANTGTPVDSLADQMQAISGIVTLILTVRLAWFMLRGAPPPPARPSAAAAPPLLIAVSGVIGPAALGVAVILLGRFTQRMVRLNRSPHYHTWHYVAGTGLLLSAGARLLARPPGDLLGLLYPLLLASSLTLCAIVTWRAWSWLLAERG